MIIYAPSLNQDFNKFGINIPLVDQRSKQCYEYLKKEGNSQLVELGLDDIEMISNEDLLLAHSQAYVELLLDKKTLVDQIVKAYELEGPDKFIPSSENRPLLELFELMKGQASMSYHAMKESLHSNFAYYLGGGMHHAMASTGRGFCLINDIVIGLRKLQESKAIINAWVIDVDAHKGDGTAQITKGDQSIKTLSIHMGEAWPFDSVSDQGDESWYIDSDVEIPLASGVSGENYLSMLEQGLMEFEGKGPRPDICIVVNGSDPFERDILPSTQGLKLSEADLLKRDLLVYNFLKTRSIPQTYLMAGGYGNESWLIYKNFLDHIQL